MNHKQEYDALKKTIIDCEKAIKNRCIECSNFNPKKRECLKHSDIPAEYIYQKNDCPEWDWLPFNKGELCPR